MDIKEILKHKKYKVSTKNKVYKNNPLLSDAMPLVEKLGFPLTLVCKLVKKYGVAKIEENITWWLDHPKRNAKNIGLFIWKLKQ